MPTRSRVNSVNSSPATVNSWNCSLNDIHDIANNSFDISEYDLFKSNNGFKCLHLNVHSLLPKMDEIRNMVSDLKIHCLSINETFLDKSIYDSEVNIENFSIFRNDRNRNGGGVALYIHTDLIPSQTNFNIETESIWAHIKLNGDTLIIGSIYRPPSSNSEYHTTLLHELDFIYSHGSDIIAMVDLNYDLLKGNDKIKISEIETLYQLNQLIHTYTRVTDTSKTIIDHIYLSNNIISPASGVLNISLRDHYPVFCVIPTSKSVRQHNTIRKRSYTRFNSHDFLHDIVSSNTFNNLITIDNVSEAWDLFKHEFLEISNRHAPITNKRIRLQSNPCRNQDILHLIRQRNYVHKLAVTTKESSHFCHYRSLRNKVTSTIRKTKYSYYTSQIQNASNNSSLMWNILKQILPSKKCTTSTDIQPDNFNEYFSTIELNISTPSDFQFLEINSNFILKELLKLGPKPKLDLFHFDNKLLHLSSPLIAPLLAHIYNLSLLSGTLPQDFKIARVSPIYKGKGDKSDPGNYRPISVTATLSKIIEKYVKTQLISHLQTNNLLSPYQSAYLKNHSTQTALHHLIDTCINNIDQGYSNLITMLDLSKGFDVLNINILLYKLKKYGITDSTYNWFHSYTTSRQQYVCINHTTSKLATLNLGVPQGTVLGPILFLIYTNDLLSTCNSDFSITYADDTSLGCKGDSSISLQTTMNDLLEKVSSWFNVNRLIVNPSKSNFITISTRHHVSNLQNISIYLNNQKLQQCSSTSLLGVHIDENLTFHQHIQSLNSKISSKISLLHRLRQILPQQSLNTIYLTTVQSLFDYCITVWGPSSKTNITSLQKLQNRCARAVTGIFDYNISVSSLITSLGWMTIYQRLTYFTACLVFKCLHNSAPSYLSHNLNYISEYHQYNTRSAEINNLVIPRPDTSLYTHFFAYFGPKIWNQLPTTVRSSNNIHLFKKALKQNITLPLAA